MSIEEFNSVFHSPTQGNALFAAFRRLRGGPSLLQKLRMLGIESWATWVPK